MPDRTMRTLSADLRREKGPRAQSPQLCVGSGRAHEGLMAEQQRHLARVKSECGFRYLRFHGLLHDDMGVYRENDQGQPIHNWQYIDLLFDYMLSIGIKPFVELGFMPQALASGSETVFWWKGNITLPRSPERWIELIKGLVAHWISRYGLTEVRSWYFEVWNEPNLRGFFAGDMQQYFEFYEYTARAINAVDPGLRVGGPATAGIGWIEEFIAFCHGRAVPVDFISTHTYGVDGHFDEYGVQQTFLDHRPDAIVRDFETVHRQVKESALPDLEIHFTEWSTSYSPVDPIHDSYHSAAYILAKLKRCESLADSLSYWTFSDIFEEPGVPPRPFHGGFGLLNIQGLPKPSFFAYKYLNRLGLTELANDDPDSWICRSAAGVQALFWNLSATGEGQSNKSWYTRDLPAAPAGTVALEIAGLPAGKHRVAIYRIGYRRNDVYTASLGLALDGSISPAQMEPLRAATADEPVEIRTLELGESGLLHLELALDQNEVVYCDISRV